MSILVTGAGGMVGSHLVELLHSQKQNVVGTFFKPTVQLTEINQEIELLECDVRYPQHFEKIMRKFQPNVIYHLAAQSYPTVSWECPHETIDVNINGTISVFEAIKSMRISNPKYDPVVVVACSSAEYGTTLEKLEDCKVKENAELLPLHPYGVSKVGQDLLAYQYFVNDGIKSIRARIFNTTGSRKVNDVTSDFTKRAVLQLKSKNSDYHLRVGNINTQRAIMDCQDLINALILLSEKGKYGEVYNISSEHVYCIKDIIKIIEKNLSVKFNLDVDPKLIRPTDERIIVGDVAKLKKDTGWHQIVTLEETVKRMIDYWKNKL